MIVGGHTGKKWGIRTTRRQPERGARYQGLLSAPPSPRLPLSQEVKRSPGWAQGGEGASPAARAPGPSCSPPLDNSKGPPQSREGQAAALQHSRSVVSGQQRHEEPCWPHLHGLRSGGPCLPPLLGARPTRALPIGILSAPPRFTGNRAHNRRPATLSPRVWGPPHPTKATGIFYHCFYLIFYHSPKTILDWAPSRSIYSHVGLTPCLAGSPIGQPQDSAPPVTSV